MVRHQPVPSALLFVALAATLAGCNGQPEDTGSTSNAPEVKTPLPALPAWAPPLMGRQLIEISRGSTTCKGKIDLISVKHVGAQKGSEVQGWAWDAGAAKPFDKIIFVNPTGKVIGAAKGGIARTDVPANLPQVKTPYVGWSGVVEATDSAFRAYGLSAGGASCVFDNSAL